MMIKMSIRQRFFNINNVNLILPNYLGGNITYKSRKKVLNKILNILKTQDEKKKTKNWRLTRYQASIRSK